jgi:hypothetical protein
VNRRTPGLATAASYQKKQGIRNGTYLKLTVALRKLIPACLTPSVGSLSGVVHSHIADEYMDGGDAASASQWEKRRGRGRQQRQQRQREQREQQASWWGMQ